MARTDPANIGRYWWDRGMPGLSLLHADFTTHEYRPHTHQALVVAVTELGGAVIRSRGVAAECEPATFFVFNPDEVQSAWMGRGRHWQYRAFYLTRTAMAAVAHDLGRPHLPRVGRNVFTDPDLIGDFLALHRNLDRGDDATCPRAGLADALGRLFARHTDDGGRIALPPHDRVVLARAIDLMRDRHAETLPLAALAREVGLTVFQLIGLFRRGTGLTPHAYLVQLRLQAACRLLRRGTPLAEVAAATGFCDQSALTRQFKNNYGITPRQLATAARG
jgi:AraC-like DNA-binding protein